MTLITPKCPDTIHFPVHHVKESHSPNMSCTFIKGQNPQNSLPDNQPSTIGLDIAVGLTEEADRLGDKAKQMIEGTPLGAPCENPATMIFS